MQEFGEFAGGNRMWSVWLEWSEQSGNKNKGDLQIYPWPSNWFIHLDFAQRKLLGDRIKLTWEYKFEGISY